MEETGPDWLVLLTSLSDIGLILYIDTVPAILKRWSRFQSGFEASAQAYKALTAHFIDKTDGWAKEDRDAQARRYSCPLAMDIYDTVKENGLTIGFRLSRPY